MDGQEQITVKDGRLRGWFWADNDIFSNKREITASAILLYLLLCRLTDKKDGKVTATVRFLAKLSRISVGGISKFAKELEVLKLIEIHEKREGQKSLPSEYVILSALFDTAQAPEKGGPESSGVHQVNAGVQSWCSNPGVHQVNVEIKNKETRKEQEEKKQLQGPANAQARLPVVEKPGINPNEGPEETEGDRKARERFERIQRERRDGVRRVFAYFCERTERNPKMYTLTDARMKVGLSRLQDCWNKTDGDLSKAEELMHIAIDALAASKFHAGDNPAGRKYNDWTDHLFKSTDKLEKWLESDQ